MPDENTGPVPATRGTGGPAPDEIRGQLDRILGHRDFEASSRTRELLRFVVEEALAGRTDRLKGYAIAIEVFGRAKDFDANLDPIVRIQAGRVRRALEHYYLVAGRRDPVVIMLPRGGYVPVFSRGEGDAVPAGASPGSLFEAVPGLPLGVGVVVMPIRELPVDAQSSFFAEGLREEFCHELSRYQDLVVIPFRREMLLPHGAGGLGDLSRRLGARFFLEGSVRRGEEQFRISAWLVDGPAGREIWSRTFTCSPNPSQIFETQEEIARCVAAVVGSEFGVISQRVAEEARRLPPQSLSTYEALLRYYDFEVAVQPEAGAQCAAALTAAVEREPEHGPLWAALAALLQNAYLLDLPGVADPLGQSVEYARRGAALAPGNQLARAVLARSHFLQRERVAFVREIEATLRLNPASPTYVGLAGYSLILADDGERGRPLLEKATAMNPCHPGWFNHALYVDDYLKGDYESALQQTLRPAFEVRLWGPLLRAAVLGQLGRAPQARAAAEELVALVPDFERRARELTHRPILSDVIVDALLDGLGKAGLRLVEA